MRVNYRLLLILAVMLPSASAFAGSAMRGDHYDLDEMYAAIYAVRVLNPELVSVEEFGKSVEGRPLLAIRIGRRDNKTRGQALITAGIHASEWTSCRVALAIAERLARLDAKDAWTDALLDNMDFYVLPLLNPDGYARAVRNLERGFTASRTNIHSVDLNRNWPIPRGARVMDPRAGSGIKWSSNYRGPRPLSEPETIALERFLEQHRFFTAINIHTTGAQFTYPWSYKAEPAPHQEIFLAMGRALNDHQPLYQYTVHQSHDWYQIVGCLNDWAYGHYGILSVTVEVAQIQIFDIKPAWRALNAFWWSNPVDINAWVVNDRDAILHAIETAFQMTGGSPVQKSELEWDME